MTLSHQRDPITLIRPRKYSLEDVMRIDKRSFLPINNIFAKIEQTFEEYFDAQLIEKLKNDEKLFRYQNFVYLVKKYNCPKLNDRFINCLSNYLETQMKISIKRITSIDALMDQQYKKATDDLIFILDVTNLSQEAILNYVDNKIFEFGLNAKIQLIIISNALEIHKETAYGIYESLFIECSILEQVDVRGIKESLILDFILDSELFIIIPYDTIDDLMNYDFYQMLSKLHAYILDHVSKNILNELISISDIQKIRNFVLKNINYFIDEANSITQGNFSEGKVQAITDDILDVFYSINEQRNNFTFLCQFAKELGVYDERISNNKDLLQFFYLIDDSYLFSHIVSILKDLNPNDLKNCIKKAQKALLPSSFGMAEEMLKSISEFDRKLSRRKTDDISLDLKQQNTKLNLEALKKKLKNFAKEKRENDVKYMRSEFLNNFLSIIKSRLKFIDSSRFKSIFTYKQSDSCLHSNSLVSKINDFLNNNYPELLSAIKKISKPIDIPEDLCPTEVINYLQFSKFLQIKSKGFTRTSGTNMNY
ncbi:MAG: hypothetical protein MHMPM18_000990 [Marteilia pararefringens]